MQELGVSNRVIRYDQRGCGLSDREVERISLEAMVDDLEAVVDAAGTEHFALLGISGGGPVAISYAARHPDRVSHLVLYGTYARGRRKRDLTAEQREEVELLQSMVRVGWGRSEPTFRRVFTSRFIPDASEEEKDWFDELQRVSASPEMAERLRDTWSDIDVTELLDEVAAPTLVAHARDEASVPFDEGRLLATAIPNARFLPLGGRNHILLANEPAWPAFLEALREFLGAAAPSPAPDLDDLSPRERDVLALVAGGLSNEEIGDRLHLSVRTVERHLSNIYAKLRVSGKAARAAVAARFSGLQR
jgi:pimeloyl-ACP methyl ester carboxylesterase/DNA-binding CsgD family transcriptional regulator